MLKIICSTVLLTACSSAAQNDVSRIQKVAANKVSVDTSSIIAPARDGNIAIREEFDAAKAKNTAKAYGLFIARHPDHALTKQAKKLKAYLENDR